MSGLEGKYWKFDSSTKSTQVNVGYFQLLYTDFLVLETETCDMLSRNPFISERHNHLIIIKTLFHVTHCSRAACAVN